MEPIDPGTPDSVREYLAKWDADFGFPRDYCCLKVITTGRNWLRDYILQVGVCMVRDGQVCAREVANLNWALEQKVSLRELFCYIESAVSHVEVQDGKPTGRVYPVDVVELFRDLTPPRNVLAWFADLLQNAQARGEYLVAHNGLGFDLPFVSTATQQWLGRRVDLSRDRLIDVGLLEKALQLGISPWSGESLAQFWNRIKGTVARGCYWSLHRHCIPKYRLLNGDQLRPELEGRADEDALAQHLLLEGYRRLARPA